MALTTTTLAAACGASDTTISVTSATGFVPQQLIQIEGEILAQTSAGSTGTRISVRRGLEGTVPAAHAVLAPVSTGTGADFAAPPPGTTGSAPSDVPPTRQAVVTFTNEQMKIGPTDYLLILPPPGARRFYKLDHATVHFIWPVPSTNVATSAWGQFVIGEMPCSNYISLSLLQFGSADSYSYLQEWSKVDPAATGSLVGRTNGFNTGGSEPYVNEPMQFDIRNPSLGNFTGGSAANFCVVTVAYRVLDVATGRWV